MNKLLLIDKPSGWTSFDVVAKIRNEARRVTGEKKIKVGHAGTLDPFATGLLIVLVGKECTKSQDLYLKQDKEYVANILLGSTSTTGDPEGEIHKSTQPDVPSAGEVSTIINKYIGEIEQTPSIYSAIKVNGQRAYKLAREGKPVEIKPRKIHIYNIDIIKYQYPELVIKVKCSSGTYIRTLAEDIGNDLGTGAYLTGLRRTQIGELLLTNAYKIDDALAQVSVS